MTEAQQPRLLLGPQSRARHKVIKNAFHESAGTVKCPADRAFVSRTCTSCELGATSTQSDC